MRRCRVVSFFLAVLLLLPTTLRAEVAVRIASVTASHFVDEPFILRLDVESDESPELPRLPDVPGLAAITVRRLPAEPDRRKHAFEIGLMAAEPGVVVVPPLAVEVQGETAWTSAVRLEIRAPRAAAEMAMEMAVEPTELRVGQPATVTVAWTSAVPWERLKQVILEIPLLADPRLQVFPLTPRQPEAERMGLPVNNLRVFAESAVLGDERRRLTFRYKLVPREPCVLRAEPGRFVAALLENVRESGQPPGYIYNQFFEAPHDSEAYDRIYLRLPAADITVRALPESGRTARYAGIVGPCDFRTSLEPTRLEVGQPALLTVYLTRLAYAGHITGLPEAALAALHPDFHYLDDPLRETAAEQAHSFTYVVRPRQAGIARVPAIAIQVFNPTSGEYQTVRSAPIAIRVDPDRESGARVAMLRAASKPPIALSGIRHNRLHEQTMTAIGNVLEFLGRYWWAILPLPLLAWLALLPLVRHRERSRRDPVYARAATALGRYRRRARRDEEAAWRHYLADRLGLCAAALTADSVTAALRARQVSGELVAETRRRFDDRDAADYGRRTVPPTGSLGSLVRRLHKVTVPLMVACSLAIPSRAKAVESPDVLFRRAMQIRETKPDEAQPLFTAAALAFEADDRFLNAGNGWFFAGESGRALVNYLAAERRFPFDRQVRESIAFIRANRADAFPAPATAAGAMATRWRRFGAWAPVLRAGVFVLAYLFAWTVFLTAQLFGWRIRRTVWASLIVAVAVPLVSLAQSSFQPAAGVIIEDTIARLGPSYAYDAAFQQPLHKAVEFSWLDRRDGWIRARLPDGSEGWLQETNCMQVK